MYKIIGNYNKELFNKWGAFVQDDLSSLVGSFDGFFKPINGENIGCKVVKAFCEMPLGDFVTPLGTVR